MSEVETPLRERLAPALRDGDARRLWQGVDARRAARVRGAPVWRAALAGAALAGALLVLIAVWPAGGRRDGALLLADGRDLVALEAAPGAGDEIALSDGSRVARDPGARLRVLENAGSVVDVLLEEGRVRFLVQKGGPRRWIVECGLLSVEVVGTHFVVERERGRARVEVIEGAVLVRGDRVPDRVRRVVGGEAIEVRAEVDAGALSATATAGVATAGLVPAVQAGGAAAAASGSLADARGSERHGAAAAGGTGEPGVGARQAAVGGGAWRELAKAAAYDRAYVTLGDGGIAKTAAGASVDVLLELSDVARFSGHPNEAIAPLTEIADRHAGDSRAPLAAFTLGRMLLERAPAAAARRFEQAVAGGLPAALVEDAMALVVEARARAGDRSGAEAAAARYEGAYANGRHREAVRRWVEPR